MCCNAAKYRCSLEGKELNKLNNLEAACNQNNLVFLLSRHKEESIGTHHPAIICDNSFAHDNCMLTFGRLCTTVIFESTLRVPES